MMDSPLSQLEKEVSFTKIDIEKENKNEQRINLAEFASR